jgi:hypothetical protein
MNNDEAITRQIYTTYAPDVDEAHDKISELLEDPDAGNDDIRDAAIDLCAVLATHYEARRAAIAKLPNLLDALLDIKRLVEKWDDHEADPFTLLELIADKVHTTLAPLPQE